MIKPKKSKMKYTIDILIKVKFGTIFTPSTNIYLCCRNEKKVEGPRKKKIERPQKRGEKERRNR